MFAGVVIKSKQTSSNGVLFAVLAVVLWFSILLTIQKQNCSYHVMDALCDLRTSPNIVCQCLLLCRQLPYKRDQNNSKHAVWWCLQINSVSASVYGPLCLTHSHTMTPFEAFRKEAF